MENNFTSILAFDESYFEKNDIALMTYSIRKTNIDRY